MSSGRFRTDRTTEGGCTVPLRVTCPQQSHASLTVTHRMVSHIFLVVTMMFDAVRLLSAEIKHHIYFRNPLGLYFRRPGVRFRCQSSTFNPVLLRPGQLLSRPCSTHFRPTPASQRTSAPSLRPPHGRKLRRQQGGPTGVKVQSSQYVHKQVRFKHQLFQKVDI